VSHPWRAPERRGAPDILNFWTNAQGFHDEEFTVPKPPGRFRIMALGDSFTFGLVPYPDAVMTRVEAGLQASCPRLALDLLNLGIGGTGLADYETLVALGVPALDPDVVLVNIYIGNDGPDLFAWPHTIEERRFWHRHSYLASYLRNVGRLARGLERDVRRWSGSSIPAGSSRARGGTTVDPTGSPSPDDRRLTGPTFTMDLFVEIMWDELRRFAYPADRGDLDAIWRPTLTILEALRHHVTARGRRLVMTFYPSVLQVYPEARAELLQELPQRPQLAPSLPAEIDPLLPNRVLLEYCRAVGLSCYDVTSDLVAASRESPAPLYKDRDTHWTIRGNRVAAKAQARWLSRLVCP
jgi:hypothetical protein